MSRRRMTPEQRERKERRRAIRRERWRAAREAIAGIVLFAVGVVQERRDRRRGGR